MVPISFLLFDLSSVEYGTKVRIHLIFAQLYLKLLNAFPAVAVYPDGSEWEVR